MRGALSSGVFWGVGAARSEFLFLWVSGYGEMPKSATGMAHNGWKRLRETEFRPDGRHCLVYAVL